MLIHVPCCSLLADRSRGGTRLRLQIQATPRRGHCMSLRYPSLPRAFVLEFCNLYTCQIVLLPRLFCGDQIFMSTYFGRYYVFQRNVQYWVLGRWSGTIGRRCLGCHQNMLASFVKLHSNFQENSHDLRTWPSYMLLILNCLTGSQMTRTSECGEALEVISKCFQMKLFWYDLIISQIPSPSFTPRNTSGDR